MSKVISFVVVTVVCENTIVRCYSQKKYHKHHQRKMFAVFIALQISTVGEANVCLY